MSSLSRRDWLTVVAAAAVAGSNPSAPADDREAEKVGELHIGTFRHDATPPIGHSCCGGWIKPIQAVDDPEEALGLVIVGMGKPIVIVVFDWTAISNSANLELRQAIAAAVGTDPNRVAVHSVHQHNAPSACLDAQAILAKHPDLPPTLDVGFFQRTVDAVAMAAAGALKRAHPLTHIASGQTAVHEIAGNRRLLGPDGKLGAMRGSSSKFAWQQEAPEGLIDPELKTIAFYSGEKKVAACHYYACHPISHYGDGRATADFVGLARRKRQSDEPDCTHLYFTGCAGDVAAGKYNDGSQRMRPILTQRIYDAMVSSEEQLTPVPIQSGNWRTSDVHLTPHPRWNAEALASQIADVKRSIAERNRPAFTLAYLQRFSRGIPITLSALRLNDTLLLHLPGECFIDYQLRAQRVAENQFVACAAYGDVGPWYIPTRDAFPLGGFEVGAAWCGPAVEQELWDGIETLLGLRPTT